MQKLLWLSLFVLAIARQDGYAQHSKSIEKTLDRLLGAEFKSTEPGIVVLIVQKGKLVYKKGFGSANIELNVPMQPGMVFKVGSITKQFTAVGILQLVEQGRLSLQDSIQKYIPGFPSKGHTITVEHLLTHTSGIKDYMTINHPDPYIERHDFTPEVIIDHFKNAPLEFTPGTKYNYTNSGYVLLGYIIEKVTGQKYHGYITDNVIKAAGLMHTLFANENTILPGRVSGYTRDAGYFQNAYWQRLSIGYACGDLLSTAEDLYTWTKALLAYKVIKKETLEKAFTPYVLENGKATGYGYGWFNNLLHGKKCIHHEGQVSGFIAMEAYFPEQDNFVSILTNVKSGEDKTDFSDRRFRLFDKIVGLSLGEALQKGITLSNALLSSYTGTYQLATDSNRTITLVQEKDFLLARIPGQGTVQLVFTSPATFEVEGIAGVKGELVSENGKVTKMVITQGDKYEWKKIK